MPDYSTLSVVVDCISPVCDATIGGLLMGNMYTMRPDLFGAVHCAVPLLDMKRFNQLLAGASWMAGKSMIC